jgi:hypothetical protein
MWPNGSRFMIKSYEDLSQNGTFSPLVFVPPWHHQMGLLGLFF